MTTRFQTKKTLFMTDQCSINGFFFCFEVVRSQRRPLSALTSQQRWTLTGFRIDSGFCFNDEVTEMRRVNWVAYWTRETCAADNRCGERSERETNARIEGEAHNHGEREAGREREREGGGREREGGGQKLTCKETVHTSSIWLLMAIRLSSAHLQCKNTHTNWYPSLNHLWRAIIRDFPLGTILLTPEYYSPLQAT